MSKDEPHCHPEDDDELTPENTDDGSPGMTPRPDADRPAPLPSLSRVSQVSDA